MDRTRRALVLSMVWGIVIAVAMTACGNDGEPAGVPQPNPIDEPYDGPRCCVFRTKYHISCASPDDPPDTFEPGCIDGVGRNCDLAVLDRTHDTDGECSWSKSHLNRQVVDSTCKQYWAEHPEDAKLCSARCGY